MSQQPRPTRRQVLAGTLRTGALAAGALGPAFAGGSVTTLLGGCATQQPGPPPPDPLQPLLSAALADVELAEAVAVAHPPLTAVARGLANDRRRHAEALQAEIRRATPSPPTSSSQSVSGSIGAGAPGPSVPGDRAAASAALVDATRTAQRQAGQLVVALPRYRAGLVASLAACCASHLMVLA